MSSWSHENLFGYFKTSPEVIRLAVMLYVKYPLSLLISRRRQPGNAGMQQNISWGLSVTNSPGRVPWSHKAVSQAWNERMASWTVASCVGNATSNGLPRAT